MSSNPDVAIGISNLQPRFTELDESATDMVEELLPYAFGTATHGHGLTLDSTCQTIENLETILAAASEDIASRNLTTENDEIRMFLAVFSVYLGEVFRLEHQGEWLEAHYDELGTSTLCVRSRSTRVIYVEPFIRVQKRLFDGAEFNVANY